MKVRILCLTALATLIVQATASADLPQRAVRLNYVASARCPTQRDFEARVRFRYPSVKLTGEGQDLVTLRISVAEDGGTASGEMEILWDDAVTKRIVSGETCDEVVSALAVIAVLALEGYAEPDAAEDEAETRRESPQTPQPRPKTSAESSSGPRPQRATSPYRLQLALGLGIRTAVAPETVAGFQSHLRLARLEPSGYSMSVGLFRSQSGEARTAAGVARFDLTAGELRGCPWLWRGGQIQAGPCVSLEAGMLQGRGDETQNRVTQRGWWLAPAALLDWRIDLSRVVLSAGGGAAFPVVRDRFYFDIRRGTESVGTIVAHQAPFVDWRAEVTFGVSLYE